VDGPTPDRRAAWCTWPQLLRLRDGQPFGSNDTNPIGALFARVRSDAPSTPTSGDLAPGEIVFGATRLIVYPTYGAYRDLAKADLGAS
jgi:hypothetical protein